MRVLVVHADDVPLEGWSAFEAFGAAGIPYVYVRHPLAVLKFGLGDLFPVELEPWFDQCADRDYQRLLWCAEQTDTSLFILDRHFGAVTGLPPVFGDCAGDRVAEYFDRHGVAYLRYTTCRDGDPLLGMGFVSKSEDGEADALKLVALARKAFEKLAHQDPNDPV